MTQETGTGGAGSNLAEAAEQVNNLLRELEAMVNPEQHEALTEFFSEWSVLSALRTTREMNETDETSSEKGA